MIFKFLANVTDEISIYNRNTRLFDFCISWLKPHYPVKDKWLNLYRQCQFNDNSEKGDLAYVTKYLSTPLNQESYKKFQKNMKVAFYSIMIGQLERYKKSGYISEGRFDELVADMIRYLKKSEKDVVELIKIYEKFVMSSEYSNYISKHCFDNSLTDETLRSLSDFLSNFLKFFELELIEGKIKV